MKGEGKGKGKVIKWEIPEKSKLARRRLARQDFSLWFSLECSLDKKTSRTQNGEHEARDRIFTRTRVEAK